MPIWKKFIHSLGQMMKGRSLSQKRSSKRKLSRKKGRITKSSKSKSSLKKKQFSVSKKRIKSLKRIKAAPKSAPQKAKTVPVGEITHFFSRIGVVVVKITKGEIAVGEQLHIKGRTTDFIQKVKSLQIESVDVKRARRGQLVGLKVDKQAKAGDKVFILLRP